MSVSLRLFPSSYYARVRWREQHRSREIGINLNCTDKKVALDRLQEVKMWESQIREGKISFSFSKDKIKPKTLNQLVQEYLKARKEDPYNPLRPSTLRLYEDNLLSWLNHGKPHFPARMLGQEHIDQYVKYMVKGGLSPHTVNLRIRTLRTFWSWSIKKYNWLAPVEFPQVQAPLNYQYFTDHEFDRILHETPSHFLKEVFNLFRDTGARKSEISKFGRIEGLFYILPGQYSKTRVERIIPIQHHHIHVIEEMQSLTFSPDYYSRKFKEACRAAGVEGRFHGLRATFIIRKWLETKDLYLVSVLAGHKQITTTQIYAQFDLRKLEQDFPKIKDNQNASIL